MKRTDWEVVGFDAAVGVISDGGKRLAQSAYLSSGALPVVDQGDGLIGGFTDRNDLLYDGPLPVILFGDHTRRFKLVEFPFVVGAQGVKILRPASKWNARFLLYALRNSDFPNLGYSRHFQYLRKVSLPCPPRAVQDRVVAEIEKQFTRLDAGVEALKRLQAHLRRYRAAVLKAAVEGKLVSTEAARARVERRDFEPAATLLARIEAPPRPNRWGSRSKDVALGHAALAVGNPGTELPEGWAWSALVDVARMESGHTPSREHPEWWDGDVPWIGIADARERDGGTIHDTLQHTNSAGLDNSAARLLPAGTVCVSRTASVGYVVVTGRPMATSQDFVNWTPTGAVSPDWLRLVFSADREALRSFGKGSVHKTIYFPEWLSVHVAVPPLAEQARIVAEADRLLSAASHSAKLVDAWLGRSVRLRQSILKYAFEGKLTSQPPP